MTKLINIRCSLMTKVLVLVLVVCYILSPLQQTLRYSLHTIDHALSQVEAEQHTHNDLMQTRMGRRVAAHHHSQETHQHKVLSFFNALFDDDQTSKQNTPITDIAFDKHITKILDLSLEISENLQKHQFYYSSNLSFTEKGIELPPPETTS